MATAGAAKAQLAHGREEATDLAGLAHARLAGLLPRDGVPSELQAASAAGLLGSGKRVRPVMAMLACAYAGDAPEAALDWGCAVEMIHAASLILDDLPCMDDARMRRGAPTVHLAHGEDAAILSAIALQALAHRVVLDEASLSATLKVELSQELSAAVGYQGLASGQMRDLRDGPAARTESGLRSLNHLKTGALFVAALRGGGRIGGASPSGLRALTDFAERIGYAFQLCDDLKDVLSTVQAEGKDVGKDDGKRTFVDLWGADRVRAEIGTVVAAAEADLGPDGVELVGFVRGLFVNAGIDG